MPLNQILNFRLKYELWIFDFAICGLHIDSFVTHLIFLSLIICLRRLLMSYIKSHVSGFGGVLTSNCSRIYRERERESVLVARYAINMGLFSVHLLGPLPFMSNTRSNSICKK